MDGTHKTDDSYYLDSDPVSGEVCMRGGLSGRP